MVQKLENEQQKLLERKKRQKLELVRYMKNIREAEF